MSFDHASENSRELERIRKRVISLRYWLQGREYYDALRTMNVVEGLYEGKFRKDGITPEFDHPVSIAHFTRTLLPGLQHPEACLSAALAHDLGEPPYNLSRSEYESFTGFLAARAVECMTKKHREIEYDPDTIFEGIARDPVASVIKPIDRNHNYQTMVGVFSPEKQERYIREGYERFLPMLKISRRLFPQQELVYENIKHVMTSQIRLIEASLRAGEKRAA